MKVKTVVAVTGIVFLVPFFAIGLAATNMMGKLWAWMNSN